LRNALARLVGQRRLLLTKKWLFLICRSSDRSLVQFSCSELWVTYNTTNVITFLHFKLGYY
jgi:hypothetical protein